MNRLPIASENSGAEINFMVHKVIWMLLLFYTIIKSQRLVFPRAAPFDPNGSGLVLIVLRK
jgi:hypothetical protein